MDALFEAPAKLPAVPARHPGWCHICEHRIVANHELIVKVGDRWVHVDCAEAEGHEVTSYD